MTERHTAPYGSWKSPITADLIVSGAVGLGEIHLDGADTYWLEGRPSEGGRSVIVRRDAHGSVTDVNAPPFNVRTRVHEYGGGAYVVDNGTVYYSNFADNRLYRQQPGGEPEPITPEAPLRYGDLTIDRGRTRLICVREDHSDPKREAINTLVIVDLAGAGDQRVIALGNDFYSSPAISPDGSQLAWLTWNHPNMPWDGSELWVGELGEDGSIDNPRCVAGGVSESIFQPRWAPDGRLYFTSDRTGWWNLYRVNGGEIEAIAPDEAEYGGPQWILGLSVYGFASAERIICGISRSGMSQLTTLETRDGRREPFDIPYTQVSSVNVQPSRVVFLGGSPTEAPSIVQIDLHSGEVDVLRRAMSVSIDEAYISHPEPIEFPTEHGLIAHAFYYPPKNREYAGPQGEAPPLIVDVHGGPTGAVSSTLSLSMQYWTSRGFAVLDVNYGGSTGYGRAYRERLNGQWGVVDVVDAANGARYLVDGGKADLNRLIIHGGSAGGYTTLAALAFSDVFAAGASYFGIADLDPFIADTHKFESRYVDRLVGPYPGARDLYRRRSPIHYIDQFTSPVILFQGLDDKVVPPNQAEIMVEGLRKKGLPYAYVPYEGEGHGFRMAKNIKRTLEGELYFYSRVFGFGLPDDVEPVQIENLVELEAMPS